MFNFRTCRLSKNALPGFFPLYSGFTLILLNPPMLTFNKTNVLERKYDLEERLVEYTCRMIDVVQALPCTRTGNYLAGQLVRACHSPAFNYGEAQAAESPKDFIHKMGIILKELKECRIALKILRKKLMISPIQKTTGVLSETEELIAIIAKSIITARKNISNNASN